jgi:hypothetical protein
MSRNSDLQKIAAEFTGLCAVTDGTGHVVIHQRDYDTTTLADFHAANHEAALLIVRAVNFAAGVWSELT